MDSNSDHVRIFGSVIGHLGAEFSQKLVKICAAAKNLDTCVYFGMSGRYNQPGETLPIKAERLKL